MPTNAAVQISVWLRLRNAINSAHKMILNAAKINHDRKNSRKIYAPLLSVYVNFPKSTKVCTGFAKSFTPPYNSIAVRNVVPYKRKRIAKEPPANNSSLLRASTVLPFGVLCTICHIPFSRSSKRE